MDDRKQVIKGFIIFLIFTIVIVCVLVHNLNRVTLIGWDTSQVKHVDNVTVEQFLAYVGVIGRAEKMGIRVIDKKSELNREGKYLLTNLQLSEQINQDTSIKLSFVEVQEKRVLKSIPPSIEVRRTNLLAPGERKVIRQGVTGVKEDYYRLSFKDGQLVSKALISSRVMSKPVKQVVEEGVAFVVVSRGVRQVGKKIKPGGPYDFRATAYTHTGRNTSLGIKPKKGIVAVDPRIIPYGTKLHITGYGYAVAADTGGAIRGNKLDVFFETRGEALKWGNRKVKVTVIK